MALVLTLPSNFVGGSHIPSAAAHPANELSRRIV